MKLLRYGALAWLYLCCATALAEAGVLAVLWQRGQLTHETLENVLIVAREVPIREMYDKRLADAEPVKKDVVTFAQVEEARMLANLDLDLRDLSADKGLADAQQLDLLLQDETIRYAQVKGEFDTRWLDIQKDAENSKLMEVSQQIGTVSPGLAKDQLLRILNDEQLTPEIALRQVVTIFRSLPIEKRKKIILEFKDRETESLHEILRQIRLGMPQITLIRETREQLNQFGTPK